MIFPICKERWGDRFVYALLLERMQDPDSFKRVGLVELECYHLCSQAWCKITTCMHPIQTSSNNIKREHYETRGTVAVGSEKEH